MSSASCFLITFWSFEISVSALRFPRLFPKKKLAARAPSGVTILFQFLLKNWSALLKNDPIDSLLGND